MDFLTLIKDSGTLNFVMICALALIVWLTKKGLGAFENNMKKHGDCIQDLYEKHNNLSNSFNLLLGNHEARYGTVNRRRKADQTEL